MRVGTRSAFVRVSRDLHRYSSARFTDSLTVSAHALRVAIPHWRQPRALTTIVDRSTMVGIARCPRHQPASISLRRTEHSRNGLITQIL